MEKTYTKLKKIGNKNGDVEFQAEIPEEVLEHHTLAALADVAENFSLPGFRKGKVPHAKVREHVSEMELLESAANDAVRDAMEEIAEDEKIDVIGRPQVRITKMAPKNPLEFTIRYAVFPEITLPDYKKISKTIFERKDNTDVTEIEVDEALERIQKMLTPSPEGENLDGTKKQLPLPALTDETVKQFGNFATVADFRTELKRQLAQEKELHMKDGRREEMIKEIVAKTKIKVPELLIEQELFEFITDRDDQLKAAGITLDDYLTQNGKTAEQLEKDERKLIEDDLRMSITVQEIRKKEGISAEDRDIHILMAKMKLRYPERSEETLHRTAEAMIIQDKLFAILEGKPETEPETLKESGGETVVSDAPVKKEADSATIPQ